MRLPLPKPRFSLRLLLLVITLASISFAAARILYYPRPLTVKEIEAIESGMTSLEVRWRLGAPHSVVNTKRKDTSWRFSFADAEGRKYQYLVVTLQESRVTQLERVAYISGFTLDVF